MNFSFTVGESEITTVEFSKGRGFWDWFFGKVTITANGTMVYANNVFNPTTHFSLTLHRYYEFTVGQREPKTIRIEKIRPLFLAPFRSQKYKVFCNDKFLREYEGL